MAVVPFTILVSLFICDEVEFDVSWEVESASSHGSGMCKFKLEKEAEKSTSLLFHFISINTVDPII